MTTLTEGDVEQAALAWLDGLGWSVAHGPDIAPGTPDAERSDYGDVILAQRLRNALARFNPRLPASVCRAGHHYSHVTYWKRTATGGSPISTMTQEEFDAILADETKEILGNIVWNDDTDHSPAQEFRAEVNSDTGHPMFIQGRYNPLAGKLTFAIILWGEGRIYGLDLGADHRNPDGALIGDKHKNCWREGYRDKWAYVPPDITKPWDCPVEVWQQFCKEARLRHRGMMSKPATQMGLPL